MASAWLSDELLYPLRGHVWGTPLKVVVQMQLFERPLWVEREQFPCGRRLLLWEQAQVLGKSQYLK